MQWQGGFLAGHEKNLEPTVFSQGRAPSHLAALPRRLLGGQERPKKRLSSWS
jgi:hypothetical protein